MSNHGSTFYIGRAKRTVDGRVTVLVVFVDRLILLFLLTC